MTSLNVVGKSNFSGNTNGNNPIIYISQNSAWDNQNYALYVNGYTYLNGFRINGNDGQRSLYNHTNPIGFAVGNTSEITFTQNAGNERMRIHSNGFVGIGTTAPSAGLHVSGTTVLNNATTCLSSLNVVGNIIGSGTALTNLNYNAITNKPDLTGYAINTNLNSISSYSYLNISGTNII